MRQWAGIIPAWNHAGTSALGNLVLDQTGRGDLSASSMTLAGNPYGRWERKRLKDERQHAEATWGEGRSERPPPMPSLRPQPLAAAIHGRIYPPLRFPPTGTPRHNPLDLNGTDTTSLTTGAGIRCWCCMRGVMIAGTVNTSVLLSP